MSTQLTETFVLVHGGRHGGWCWQRVAAQLRAAGHRVITPTLTGLGERSHLLHPQIGLETHITDIVNVLEYEDLQRVVLVAHSYAGLVIAGAMERVSSRVERQVFIDAYMPYSGESMLDLVPQDKRREIIANAESNGEGWKVPPTDARYWGVVEPSDVEWVNSRVTSQPLKSYRDAVGSTTRSWAGLRTFIECRDPESLKARGGALFERARDLDGADPRFCYVALTASHDAMITHPRELSDLIMTAYPSPISPIDGIAN